MTIGKLKSFLKDPYNFLLCTFVIYFIFAFTINTPTEILNGLINIIWSPDILVTDYIYLGGVGATLVNAASVGIVSVLMMKFFKCEYKGLNIMSIWLAVGFGFFGKNVFNIAPILFGGYLYSLYHRKKFSNFAASSLLATSLSPVVSQIPFIGITNPFFGVTLGMMVGVILGFIMIPISAFTVRAHAGYNLYNAGFAAGILSIIILSLFTHSGVHIQPVSLWSSGHNKELFLFLLTINMFLILVGVILSDFNIIKSLSLHDYKKSSAIMDDRYVKKGALAYLNMGVMGMISTLFVLGLGGELSGPLVGGIFTIIGFSCLGKTFFNIGPPMLGCYLVMLMSHWDVSTPGYLLTTLFSATLAPISSSFGAHWGIIAGIIHMNLAVTLTSVHGGLNLYNNGMAGGFVAMLLVPVILSLKRKEAQK